MTGPGDFVAHKSGEHTGDLSVYPMLGETYLVCVCDCVLCKSPCNYCVCEECACIGGPNSGGREN